MTTAFHDNWRLRSLLEKGPAIVIVAVLLASTCSFAQGERCSFTEISQSQGFKIPGLESAALLGKRGPLPNIKGVYITLLEPAHSGASFARYTCTAEHASRLQIDEIPVQIIHLRRFDFDGRVFAYYLHVQQQAWRDGVLVDAGTESSVFFYDLDGSGRFTLRKWAQTPVPDLVPEWVYKKSE